MGAWGAGPFENDGAGDFEAALCSAHAVDPTFLEATLREGDAPYIEIDAGQALIACANVIACMRGLARTGVPERVCQWMDRNASAPAEHWVAHARAALDAVMSGPERSEIFEVWQDADELEIWRASVERIRAHLKALC